MCIRDSYAAAREIGNEGIVLLKNAPVIKKGAPLLPIDAAKYQNILVVGDNACLLYTSDVYKRQIYSTSGIPVGRQG